MRLELVSGVLTAALLAYALEISSRRGTSLIDQQLSHTDPPSSAAAAAPLCRLCIRGN